MLDLLLAMIIALYGILASLIMGHGVGADVAGPVGIAVLTKQVTTLGSGLRVAICGSIKHQPGHH